ncbi:MAG TPA: hypothetical protein VJP77_01345, partial [Planctomycetota bacterium]|nr:hypothetical protein [Planctomycetota bacterium]
MQPTRTFAAVAALGAAVATSVVAFTAQRSPESFPQLPAVPQAVAVELVEAHAFTLDQPTTHWMRAEQPQYATGHVLVLRTDPELLVPRQTLENVLYVGAETVERVNLGHESGFLVAIVPGEVDLAAAPIFFGEPALPEQVTAAEAARQLGLARERGVA